jgi:hypothetical protein
VRKTVQCRKPWREGYEGQQGAARERERGEYIYIGRLVEIEREEREAQREEEGREGEARYTHVADGVCCYWLTI